MTHRHSRWVVVAESIVAKMKKQETFAVVVLPFLLYYGGHF